MKLLLQVAAITTSLLLSTGSAYAEKCQVECNTCAKVCKDALKYCKKTGGKHAAKEHLKVLKDCIQACSKNKSCCDAKTAADKQFAKECAELCEKCATSCESLGDKALNACVEECRKCAKVCLDNASS